MIALDPQLARLTLLLAADRPAPEPAEAEVRRVLEHIATSPEATTKATTTEAAQ
jgi:hypothetical protein